jgi:hypothetical protein
MHAIGAALVGGVLAACAVPVGPEHWAGNASERQLARDEYACRRDAELAYGATWGFGAPGGPLYTACMKAKGYTRRP